MTETYSTGVWWIDLLVVIGISFLALLAVGLPVWAIRDRIRYRREDALESTAAKASKNTATVTNE